MKPQQHTLISYALGIAFCMILAGLHSSCRKEGAGCFRAAGKITEEIRNPGNFSCIDLDDDIDLTIRQGNAYAVKIQCGSNLMEGIETSISGEWLTLRNNNRCNWMRDMDEHISMEITMPQLKKLKYSGYGKVQSIDTLKGQTLEVDAWNGSDVITMTVDYESIYLRTHTGPADFHFSGYAGYTYIFHAGNGFHHLEDLASGWIHAESKATGDMYIWPLQQLYVHLKGEGSIYYKGNPQIHVLEEIGRGSILPMD